MSYRMVAILTSLRPKPRCLSKFTAKGLMPMIALTAGFSGGELCALMLAGSARAADVPAKTPAAMPAKAPAAPAYSWTGCYVGANAGGAAGGSVFTTSVGPGTHLTNPGRPGGRRRGGNRLGQRQSLHRRWADWLQLADRDARFGR